MADSRWDFSKRALEQPVEVQVLAGGQTTLSGKDTSISIDKLQPGRSSIDNSATVHASVFDSPSLHKFIQNMGGTDAIEKIYVNRHLDQGMSMHSGLSKDVYDNEVNNEDLEPLPLELHNSETLLNNNQEEELIFLPPMVSKFRHLLSDNKDTDPTCYTDTRCAAQVKTNRTIVTKALSESPTHKCVSEECDKNIPENAKFCPECGTAQLSKFCIECSYKFQLKEKFCPDCGTHR